MSDGFDGIGHGAGPGEMMEAGAKMNMQAREADARLKRKHPGHDPSARRAHQEDDPPHARR